MVVQNKGFTLIELMITVAVVAIVAAIAIPSFTEQIRNNRAVTLSNDFVDTVSFARSQAVSRPARISICPSDDGEECTADWADGYMVFVDDVDTDITIPPSVGEVLKFVRTNRPDVEMTAAFGANATTFIRFTTIGTLARVSADPLRVQTKITDCKGNYARSIGITLAGQVTASPQDCDVEL